MLTFHLLILPLLTLSAPLEERLKGYEQQSIVTSDEKEWRDGAIRKLWKERKEMGHTPLVKLPIPGVPSASIYFKKETESKSGTLKHRFAWALVMWGVVEGKIKKNTTVYDSTSGNTGASEAYMCKIIGVPYFAVVAKNLENEKVQQIKQFDGQVVKVDVSLRNSEAQRLAKKNGGFFINQFGNADAAEEYHESGNYEMESTNVFHEIYKQLKNINQSHPDYFIHSAGTGGTISSVGKYVTRYSIPTKIILADSQFSLFYDYVAKNLYTNVPAGPNRPAWKAPGVAGIGYGYNPDPIIFKNTTSLLRTVVDEVVRMPDMATVAAMRSLSKLGMDAGASTSLNFLVALDKALKSNTRSSYVLIMGDPGKFYDSTYLGDGWVEKNMKELGGRAALKCWEEKIDRSIKEGSHFLKEGKEC